MTEFMESGVEPEYFITEVLRAEPVADSGLVRFYIGREKRGRYELLYTVVATPADLMKMGQQVLDMTTEAHNMMRYRLMSTPQHH